MQLLHYDCRNVQSQSVYVPHVPWKLTDRTAHVGRLKRHNTLSRQVIIHWVEMSVSQQKLQHTLCDVGIDLLVQCQDSCHVHCGPQQRHIQEPIEKVVRLPDLEWTYQ